MNVPRAVLDLTFSDGLALSEHIAGDEVLVVDVENEYFCNTWALRLEMSGHNPAVHRTATQILAFMQEAGDAHVCIYMWSNIGISALYNTKTGAALLLGERLWKPPTHEGGEE